MRMGRAFLLALCLVFFVQILGGQPSRDTYDPHLRDEYHPHPQDYHPHGRVERSANLPTRETDWWELGRAELQDSLSKIPQVGVAKNVILFIGDGMGPSTVTAARIFQAQMRGVPYKDSTMTWESFPHTSIMRTNTVDKHVADSAGAATSILGGEKTRQGLIGLKQGAIRGDCSSSSGQELKSILKHAQDKGKWTGVVTTTRITSATPAASYAFSCERYWEVDGDIPVSEQGLGCTDLSAQLMDDPYAKNIRVILGGGRRTFYPAGMPDPEEDGKVGRRQDNQNLIEEWILDKYDRGLSSDKVHYVMNSTDFDNVDPENAEFLLGLFSSSHMQLEALRTDPMEEKWGEPSIAEMTEKAIRMLSRNEDGYFLLVEGGRIDHAHHVGYAAAALNETVALSDAVQKAMELTSGEDTLVVVTADHSHVMTISGYADIESDILGLEGNMDALDGLPYTSLAYTNGPGYEYHRGGRTSRRDLTPDAESGMLGSPTYVYDASVPLEYDTHGGEDVAAYATGPMSHLFKGVRQQNFIAHVMMYASCVGPYEDACNPETVVNAAMFTHINGALVMCLVTLVELLKH